MPARQYRSTVEAKVLNQPITSGSTTIILNSVTTLPTSYPYTLVIAPDTISEEIVTVTSSAGGNSLNVTRGQDGTTAQSHNLGDAVRHMITARDLQEPQDHINNGGYHVLVCTSTTRPSSPVDGQHIYETDTDKTLSWNGSTWNPVSGAASYTAGEPANPSVGSLWVDSDETAAQLNTNDFLLKADAEVGYATKIEGVRKFADAAARSSAIPTPSEGMVSYRTDVNGIDYYNGSAWVGANGLDLLNTTSFSAQATVNIDNVFSSTYENYLITLNVTSQTVSGPVGSQFRTSGTPFTTSNYGWQTYGPIGWDNATWTTNVYLSQSYHQIGGFTSTGLSGTYAMIQVFNPNTARRTFGVSQTLSENEYRGRAFQVAANNQFDGLSFYNPSGGTITGTIRVYGLRNA